MRILVCVKRVPLTGGKIVLTADAQAIETKHLGFTISPHEECGVEEAVRLIEAHGGESVVLTLGPPEAEEQLRDAMALGADRAIHLVSDGEEWDPQATATAIVDAIRGDETANGPFDLVVFGNESADAGGFQIGIRVAYALGRPVATGLKGVGVEGETRALRAGGRRRTRRLRPPSARGRHVLEGLNLPRYPSVPAKLRAQRKPRGRELAGEAGLEAREAPARRSRGTGQGGGDPRPRARGGARRRGGAAAGSAWHDRPRRGRAHAGRDRRPSLQAIAFARASPPTSR